MCFCGIPYQNCRYRFENNRVVEDSSAEVDDLLVAHRRSSRGGGTKGSLDLSSKSSFRQLRERQVMTSPCYLCVAMRILFLFCYFRFCWNRPKLSTFKGFVVQSLRYAMGTISIVEISKWSMHPNSTCLDCSREHMFSSLWQQRMR